MIFDYLSTNVSKLLLILGFVVTDSFADCRWTSCQNASWVEEGCQQYSRDEYARQKCNLNYDKGIKYYCCRRRGNITEFPFIELIGDPDVIGFNQFITAVTNNGYPAPSHIQYTNFKKFARIQGKISSVQEAAMSLAQFIYETSGLIVKRESKCKYNNCPDEYRDQYYYGRGYIQMTWCFNYRDASAAIFGDNRLVSDPDLVARDESVAWRTAFWYWGKRIHNAPGVQGGRFGATTKAINSFECRSPAAQKRFEIYGKVRTAFGLIGLGDPSGCS